MFAEMFHQTSCLLRGAGAREVFFFFVCVFFPPTKSAPADEISIVVCRSIDVIIGRIVPVVTDRCQI